MAKYQINDIINNWKIINILGKTKHNHQLYECECQCLDKTIRIMEQGALSRNKSKSCGCLQKLLDRNALIGQTFNNLVVIEFLRKNQYNRIVWKCLCSCGEYCEVTTADLKSGHVKSCGHLINEAKIFKHGMTRSTEYNSYMAMKRRCLNKDHNNFPNYGARGITICERWLDSEKGFINFIADMGLKPNKNFTIGRKDNNGNYEPTNCSWESYEDQNRNTRGCKISSMEQADEIRDLYSTGNYTQEELGEFFGCCPSNISMIINDKTWYKTI